MPASPWWDSYDRIDRTFRRARNTAIVASGLAIVSWGLGLVLIAVPATVLTMVAILITLFTWFRRDDLSRPANRPDEKPRT